MLMSGTPIENRPSEMIALIAMLQPSLGRRLADSHDAGTLGPLRFRKAIAPVYLRRKQEDVLPELPEMIEEDEWVGPDLDGPWRVYGRPYGRHLPRCLACSPQLDVEMDKAAKCSGLTNSS